MYGAWRDEAVNLALRFQIVRVQVGFNLTYNEVCNLFKNFHNPLNIKITHAPRFNHAHLNIVEILFKLSLKLLCRFELLQGGNK